ncbi:MAG TPA: hypothetical protein VEY96_08015 [Actinomycetes bacterium]|nr:hypothetical protein [Actinomycetes bacterium]
MLVFGEDRIDDASGPCRFGQVGIELLGEGDQAFPERPAAASRPGSGPCQVAARAVSHAADAVSAGI